MRKDVEIYSKKANFTSNFRQIFPVAYWIHNCLACIVDGAAVLTQHNGGGVDTANRCTKFMATVLVNLFKK